MAQYQVVFHVEESSEEGSREWLSRVLQILQQYKDVLISKSTGKGTWCSGHIFPPVELSGIIPDSEGIVPKPRP